MFTKPKKDIAISVAEEDKGIAEQIAAALTLRKISYYLYSTDNNRGRNWGQHLLKISLDQFGARARYVLLIVSRHTPEAYWSGIERRIATMHARGRDGYILPLKIADARVDDDIVYIEWDNDPEDIAERLKDRLRERQHEIMKRWREVLKWAAILLATAFVIVAGVYISHLPPYSTSKYNGQFIRAGSFYMGDKKGCNDEKPVHRVNISAFRISQVEVTVDQYREYCVATNKPEPKQLRQHGDYPVTGITWQDASDYCKWAGGRLPTEAEWEYATNRGISYKYSGGNNASKVAVYHLTKASSVGTRTPNMDDVYDMTGNVAEWCADWYDSTYYSRAAPNNPVCTDKGNERVVRGGSYKNQTVGNLLVTHRDKESPDSCRDYIGFRVVWDQ